MSQTYDPDLLKLLASWYSQYIEENRKNQPNYESDPEFGFVPNKPIYTLGIKLVDGEEDYLNSLQTVSGNAITWSRHGSITVDGVNGPVDKYDTFIDNQLYKTIYINMYGAVASSRAPDGFRFATTSKKTSNESTSKTDIPRSSAPLYCIHCGALLRKEALFCPQCGARVAREIGFEATKSTIPANNSHSSSNFTNTQDSSSISGNKFSFLKYMSFTHWTSLVLSVISFFSILIALKSQDTIRDFHENWMPSKVYGMILLLIGGFIVLTFLSLCRLRLNHYFTSFYSIALLIAVIVNLFDGSIFARGVWLGSYKYYANNEIVSPCNVIWVICTFLIVILHLILMTYRFRSPLASKIYSSISYRERCYKRLELLHSYLEKGIITEQEYEDAKKIIMDKVQ